MDPPIDDPLYSSCSSPFINQLTGGKGAAEKQIVSWWCQSQLRTHNELTCDIIIRPVEPEVKKT